MDFQECYNAPTNTPPLEIVMAEIITAIQAQIKCWVLDAKLAWNSFQIFLHS